jgi:hypothetical protein
MERRTYNVTLTGSTPLLMHHDDIAWADLMEKWKNDPANKKNSKAGDDRSPAFRWLGSLYHDATSVALPSDNLMTCMMEGGSLVLVPGGKSGKTFKAQTQSGMLVGEPFWPLEVGAKGQPILMADLEALKETNDFDLHIVRASELGFSLFLKRAKIGQAKHIRVRPRFDVWSASGTIVVWDEQITKQVLLDVLMNGGRYKGLGDWRPGSPRKPGPFGTFTAEVREAKQ